MIIVPGFISKTFLSAEKKTEPVVANTFTQAVLRVFKRLAALRKYMPVNIHGTKSSSGYSRSAVTSLRKLHLRAGIKALRNAGNKKAAHYFEDMLAEDGRSDNEDSPASSKDIKSLLALQKEIKDTLAMHLKQQCGCSKGVARDNAKKNLDSLAKEILNNTPWDIIHDRFSFADRTFDSTLIPAGQLKLGAQDIFAVSYENKGICSKSTDETIHAPNLWATHFKVKDDNQQEMLFTGLRHAVLSPFHLDPGSAERKEGALNRAREVAAAALFLRPEKLAAALAGKTVDLPLTSTSLLTPVDIGPSTEKSQLRDQMEAWKDIGAKPIVLVIRDQKGDRVPVTVRLDIAAFNFGVNQLALGRLGLGHGFADSYNLPALTKLLGRDLSQSAPHGGWVGQYLATLPRPANAERVSSLASELKQIWSHKSHHDDNGEPYKAAMRVALLSYEIGITPCWNCKSGKDRTGILDAVIKHNVVNQYLYKRTLPLNGLHHESKALVESVMLNTGNLQVQQYNTGAPGNKCLNENRVADLLFNKLTLRAGLGDDIADKVKSLADRV